MAKVNRDLCEACGLCIAICEEGIEMRDGKAFIKNPKAECLQEAADSCPTKAIRL